LDGHGVDRRSFVRGSLAAVAAARVPRLARPSDELRVAVVGLNGRGVDHVDALRALPEVRVVALCDVDDLVLARESKRLREKGQPRIDVHADLRVLLERGDVDAISIASPNHWHALQTIWACQAGKDVYVEKPVTHAFAEGAPVVAAARKYGRIVQSGLQSRASPAIQDALQWLRAGNLGAIELVRGLCFKPRPSIGKTKGNQKLPDSVDYDLWCGPAPLAPLRRGRLHYDWHWFHATGNGDLGNQGVHQLDVARWALGAEELPGSVTSLGGRLGYEDDGETANSQLVLYAFEPAPLLFEVRGLPKDSAAQAGDWATGMDDVLGVRIGVIVHCAGGTLRIPSTTGAVAYDADGKELRRWEQAGDPFANWIAAVKSRRVEELSAELELGVRSSALIHLGNASQRLAKELEPKDLLEQVKSSTRLTSATERLIAHLEANGVDLARNKLSLGPCLVMDGMRTCVPGDERANALLAGSFREPFVLP
jgi:predicted dehydrogenase